MSSVQTFLIEDPRISKTANSSITVGVKSGPAHSTVQSYKFNSNTASNTLFNINVPLRIPSLIATSSSVAPLNLTLNLKILLIMVTM